MPFKIRSILRFAALIFFFALGAASSALLIHGAIWSGSSTPPSLEQLEHAQGIPSQVMRVGYGLTRRVQFDLAGKSYEYSRTQTGYSDLLSNLKQGGMIEIYSDQGSIEALRRPDNSAWIVAPGEASGFSVGFRVFFGVSGAGLLLVLVLSFRWIKWRTLYS